MAPLVAQDVATGAADGGHDLLLRELPRRSAPFRAAPRSGTEPRGGVRRSVVTTTLDQIMTLVRAGESDTLEFKKSTANLPRVGETLCGMLNGAGGIVLFGVTDAGEVVGQQVADATLREVAAMVREFEPSATIEVERVAVEGSREVLVLRALSPADEGPWLWRGRAWQRRGPTTSPLSQPDYYRLM